MRESGNYTLEELVSDIDGSEAYRFSDDTVSELLGDSWSSAQEVPNPAIQWTVDDCDHEDDDLAISLEAYALLVNRGRAHCEGCAGDCGR
jgi:hypothetical protein